MNSTTSPIPEIQGETLGTLWPLFHSLATFGHISGSSVATLWLPYGSFGHFWARSRWVSTHYSRNSTVRLAMRICLTLNTGSNDARHVRCLSILQLQIPDVKTNYTRFLGSRSVFDTVKQMGPRSLLGHCNDDALQCRRYVWLSPRYIMSCWDITIEHSWLLQ